MGVCQSLTSVNRKCPYVSLRGIRASAKWYSCKNELCRECAVIMGDQNTQLNRQGKKSVSKTYVNPADFFCCCSVWLMQTITHNITKRLINKAHFFVKEIIKLYYDSFLIQQSWTSWKKKRGKKKPSTLPTVLSLLGKRQPGNRLHSCDAELAKPKVSC